MQELSEAHVGSGRAMTVRGPVDTAGLGFTLMHEHILNDCRCWWHRPPEPERLLLAHGRVSAGILGELRMDPFLVLDNCTLDEEGVAISELRQLASAGGVTVVDPTCRGIGRAPDALVRIAKATGLQIIMGSGYYLQTSHPANLASLSADDVADEIVVEARDGVAGTGVRIGLIGEIGVSSEFTAEEKKSLRGAARAQRRTGLPLMVHLPAWFRLGHDVLDVVEAEGAACAPYRALPHEPLRRGRRLPDVPGTRGAFIEYDMIGMDYWYADQQVQCPSDEDNARSIGRLVEQGLARHILLSQDVFLKMMLTKYGGFGYAYVLRHFVPRLRRHGISEDTIRLMLVDNPRRVFDAAHET